MKEEIQKLYDKISAELFKKFPDSNPRIIEIFDKSFKYELERNDNYAYYLVGYTTDSSGELKVDWKRAEQFMQ